VFLDTCVVNLLIDHSETIHDNCAPSRLLTERGYAEAAISALPEPKKSLYDWQRRSKVLLKRL